MKKKKYFKYLKERFTLRALAITRASSIPRKFSARLDFYLFRYFVLDLRTRRRRKSKRK